MEWQKLLSTPEYISAQAAVSNLRPHHMVGDQDVLAALLGSRTFAHIELRFLRRGRHILQLFGPLGFTLRERLQVAAGELPLIIHAQRTKPWKAGKSASPSLWYSRLLMIYQDTSAYIIFVEKYLQKDVRFEWLAPKTRTGALLRRVGCGSISLSGAPVAAFFDVVYQTHRLFKRIIARSSQS